MSFISFPYSRPFLYLFCGIATNLSAQSNFPSSTKPKINVSGFSDVYYIHDFHSNTAGKREEYLFNHNRSASGKINLSVLKLSADNPLYRVNLAVHAGSYVDDNYALEPEGIRNIHEANFGVRLSKKHQMWLDLGVLPSYIGFESALSHQNWTYTRSLLAENSPYFISGAKWSIKAHKNWNFAALIINGWQRIKPLENQFRPSLGTQVQYLVREDKSINWNTFLGSDDSGSSKRNRFFNNFYFTSSLNNAWALTAGFDVGFQQTSPQVYRFHHWFSPVLILKYQANPYWRICGRVEYYEDKNRVIIPGNSFGGNLGFKAWGASLNIDYFPIQQVAIRLEARNIYRPGIQDQVYPHGNPYNQILAGSVCIYFDREL